VTAPSPQQRIDLLAELFGVAAHPRPWALPSLPDHVVEDLTGFLGRFVDLLNRAYATEEKHVIYPCWALHEGLVRELAVQYALWVDAHQGPGALSVDKAAAWHEKWLPGFQRRIRPYFGDATAQCRPDQHVENWSISTRTDAYRLVVKPPTADEVSDAMRGYRDTPATLPPPGT
jgi:hypothetical protein